MIKDNSNKIMSRLSICRKDVLLLIFILALAVIAVWSYWNLDQPVFSLLRQRPVKWEDNFWLKAFTYLGNTWVLVWLLLIWFLSTGRQRPILIAFLALFMCALTVIPLKVSVKRPRPHEVIKAGQKAGEQLDLHGHMSFPSGDTAVVFAVATVIISFVSWPLACLLLAACAGVALLRVTAMAHYPSDVFAGAAIGSFAGWLAVQINRRLLPLKIPRFNLNRAVAILAIILIPLLFGLFEGIDKLVIFLDTYGLLVICIFLAAK
jgi:undecaprenyl-diphosphatase